MKKYKNRNEVEDKYKWDLTDFYKDENDFFNSFKNAQALVNDIKKYVGCTKDNKKLVEFIDKDVNLSCILLNLNAYTYLKNDEVLGISKNIKNKAMVEDLFNDYIIATSFFNPELLELSKEEYNNLFNNKDLVKYKELLDKIYRAKDHILPKDKEDIITSLENGLNHFEDISSTMLNSEHDYGSVLIDGIDEKIAPTNLRRLLKNSDREIRKEVRKKYNEVLLRYGETQAALLNGFVKSSIINSKLHNYKNSWDSKLFRLNMPNEAYEALKNTVFNNLDVLQRYFRLFKKAVKLDKLYQYDLAIDPFNNKKEYSIEDAIDISLKAIKPLGNDYSKLFKRIFDNHYVDFCQYPSKCSGGYSLNTMDKDSRILMSYNYDLESISTLIHEGGHNVHHQIISLNNPVYYRDIPTLMAEVASLTNECLLSDYIYKNAKDKDEKIEGLHNIISVIVSNLFGAVREAKMEQDFYQYVNNNNTITKDYMDNLTYESLKKFYGDTVELDEYSKPSWERRSHYFMDFYLYNYAFCISIASYISSEILSGNKEILDKYFDYLKTGDNVYPIDAFKKIDIDIKDTKVYQKAIDYFNSLLDRFEDLIKE